MRQLLCCVLMCAAGLCPCLAQIKWVQWMQGDTSQGLFIAADKSGHTYVAGRFYGTVSIDQNVLTSRGDSDVFVVAMDKHGDVEFATSFGSPGADYPTTIAAKPNGELFVAARVDTGAELQFGEASATLGAYVAKFGRRGATKWFHTLEDTNAIVASMMTEHGNKELWMCGFGSDGLFTSARNKKGKEVFRASTSLPPEVTASAVALDRSHNAIVNGSWTGQPRLGELDFPSGASLYRGYNFVAKFGSGVQWQWIGSGLYRYGIYFHVDVTSAAIVSDRNGDIFTTGYATGSYPDLFVTHHSPTGELISATTRGEFRGSYGGLGIAVDRSGNTYTAGYGFGSWPNPNRRMAALIIGPDFEYRIRSASLEDRNFACAICLDGRNCIYVTGDFEGRATFGNTTLGDSDGSPPHAFVTRIDDAMRRKN